MKDSVLDQSANNMLKKTWKAVDQKDVPFGRQNALSHFPNGIDIGDPPPQLFEFLGEASWRIFLSSSNSPPVRWGLLASMSAVLQPPSPPPPPDFSCNRYRSECSPPDPNSKPRIRVFPAGPQLQALDCSVARRASTTSAGSQCSPWIRVFPAGPQPQRISEDEYQIECQKEC